MENVNGEIEVLGKEMCEYAKKIPQTVKISAGSFLSLYVLKDTYTVRQYYVIG